MIATLAVLVTFCVTVGSVAVDVRVMPRLRYQRTLTNIAALERELGIGLVAIPSTPATPKPVLHYYAPVIRPVVETGDMAAQLKANRAERMRVAKLYASSKRPRL